MRDTNACGARAAYIDGVTISADHTEAVDVMSAIGVFDGTDGVFNPTGNLLRSQAAKIIMYIVLTKTNADLLTTTDRPFTDVTDNHWAVNAISWCYEMGIVSGVNIEKTLFAPEATLTGTEFAKMLLVTLGYDARIEGYQDNPMWSTNINSDALTAGLRVGLESIDMSKPLTREQACQMAFNALTADMVDYASRGYEVNGVIIGASPATAIARNELNGSAVNYAGDFQNAEGLDVQQLCEFHYPQLRQTEVVDGMGRPADMWTLRSSQIGVYTRTPDYTFYVSGYTGGVTLGLVVDYGLGTYVDDTNADIIVNGVKNPTYLGALGDKVELYMNDEKVNVVDLIAVTHTNVDVVSAAPTVVANAVSVPGTNVSGVPVSLADGYENLEAGDVVMWYVDANGKYTFQKAGFFNAVMTATGANTGNSSTVAPSVYHIGGGTYLASRQTDAINMPNDIYTENLTGFRSDSTATFWLDNAGHIIWADGAPAAPVTVLQVLKNNDFDIGNIFKDPTIQSQVVIGDTGKTSVVNIARVNGTAVASNAQAPIELDDTTQNNLGNYNFVDNQNLANSWLYEYSYSASSDTYTINAVDASDMSRLSVATNVYQGIPSAFQTTAGAYADQVITHDNTIFLVRNKAGGSNAPYADTYTTYVGYKNVPSMNIAIDGALVYHGGTDYAQYVFINEYDYVSSTVYDDIYVLAAWVTAQYKADKSLSHYEVSAIVDGQKTAAQIATNATVTDSLGNTVALKDNLSAIKDHTIYVIERNSNGQIATLTEATSSTHASPTYYWVDMTGTIAARNGIIVLDTATTELGQATSFAYANDCVVYTISETGDIVTTGTIASLITDANDEVSVKVAGGQHGTANNNTVVEVYVYKQKDVATGGTVVLQPDQDPTGGQVNPAQGQIEVNYIMQANQAANVNAIRQAAYDVLIDSGYTLKGWTGTTETSLVATVYDRNGVEVTLNVVATMYVYISVDGKIVEYIPAGTGTSARTPNASQLTKDQFYDAYASKGGTGYIKSTDNGSTWSYAAGGAYSGNGDTDPFQAAGLITHVFIKTGYVKVDTNSGSLLTGMDDYAKANVALELPVAAADTTNATGVKYAVTDNPITSGTDEGITEAYAAYSASATSKSYIPASAVVGDIDITQGYFTVTYTGFEGDGLNKTSIVAIGDKANEVIPQDAGGDTEKGTGMRVTVGDTNSYVAYGDGTDKFSTQFDGSKNATVTAGYVSVAAPASATTTGYTANDDVAVTVKTGDTNITHAKVGETVTVTVTIPVDAASTTAATVTVTVTGPTGVTIAPQDVTAADMAAGKTLTFTFTATEDAVTAIATTVVTNS